MAASYHSRRARRGSPLSGRRGDDDEEADGLSEEREHRGARAGAIGQEREHLISRTSGNDFGCGVRQDGSLTCVGSNFSGTLGDGTTTDRPDGVRVGTANDWQMVSAGGGHTCAIRHGGDLYCWGANDGGAIGDGSAWSNVPRPVSLK